MKLNVGGIDRALRIIAGLALIAMTLLNMIGPWGWIGVVLVATGAARFCPLYPILGLNTCATKGKAV